MKDLYKPGRNLDEYLNEDGTLKKNCLTCLNRDIKVKWGSYLCHGGLDRYMECQERDLQNLRHKFWEPRVDVNAFITEEDIKL